MTIIEWHTHHANILDLIITESHSDLRLFYCKDWCVLVTPLLQAERLVFSVQKFGQSVWRLLLSCRYVGRFMSRKERLEQMGDRAKNFTNVYLKNFGEDIDDEKLREMMEVYGKIISAKVF